MYLKFQIDGDYLLVYKDGTLIFEFIKANENMLAEIRSFYVNHEVDFSRITFPRHADGTSDYDDIATVSANENQGMESENAPATEYADSTEEAAVSKPAPVMGKTAAVTENLRLRTDNKTTAEVVATLAAGTCVKVDAMGKEEIIDGIISNWVQVSVLDGAKDKDGNAVAAGTKGWLFGGYLSETEDMADAKQNVALPILPIAAGGAVLAILLAVVLLAVKKRKSGKE